MLDRWTELLDSGTPVDTLYLDFAKAFDSVPHQRLIIITRISKAPHPLRKIAAQGASKSNPKTNMTHTKKEK